MMIEMTMLSRRRPPAGVAGRAGVRRASKTPCCRTRARSAFYHFGIPLLIDLLHGQIQIYQRRGQRRLMQQLLSFSHQFDL